MVECRAESKSETVDACRIAVVGGGFSGVTLAAQLLRVAGPFSVVIIEKGPTQARGLAYRAGCPSLLLNVRARNMSAWVDDPLHFLRWAQLNHDPATQPGSFLPRQVYGRYLETILETVRSSTARSRLGWVREEAVAIRPGPDRAIEVQLGDGGRIQANQVVLAQGNFPARDPLAAWEMNHDSRYFLDPWTPEIFKDAHRLNHVLLIGSGLTSIDVALQLRVHGCRGTIHVLSLRGLFPQPHKATDAGPAFWNQSSPRTIRGLLRLVRGKVRESEKLGIEWQSVFDSLRPQVAQMWQALSNPEKRRFLRHLRPYWEIHRHRAAPEIAQALEGQIADGRLQVHPGRVSSCRGGASGIEVTYRDRKTGNEKTLHPDRIINCTGPESDYRRLQDPLVKSLIASGLARPDPLFLGWDTTADGGLIDRHGHPSQALYAVGPSRKGGLWESSAVPELRIQIHKLAEHLLLTVARNTG